MMVQLFEKCTFSSRLFAMVIRGDFGKLLISPIHFSVLSMRELLSPFSTGLIFALVTADY